MTTYVAAVDFSKGSRQALEVAARHAAQDDAKVVLVHAFQPGFRTSMVHGSGSLDPITQVQQEMKLEGAVELTTEWADILRRADVDVEIVAEEEDAASLILKAAKEHHADMIVVGRAGHGKVHELFLGSTADTVVRKARVPVLVVPQRD